MEYYSSSSNPNPSSSSMENQNQRSLPLPAWSRTIQRPPEQILGSPPSFRVVEEEECYGNDKYGLPFFDTLEKSFAQLELAPSSSSSHLGYGSGGGLLDAPSPSSRLLRTQRDSNMVGNSLRVQSASCSPLALGHHLRRYNVDRNFYPNNCYSSSSSSSPHRPVMDAPRWPPSYSSLPPTQEDTYGFRNRAPSFRNDYSNVNSASCSNNPDYYFRFGDRNNVAMPSSFSSSSSSSLVAGGPRWSCTSSEEAKGEVYALLARDRDGRRFLEEKLREGSVEEVHIIFTGLKNHLYDLMIDPSGYYLVLELFQACNPDQITQVLSLFSHNNREGTGALLNICLDDHGYLSLPSTFLSIQYFFFFWFYMLYTVCLLHLDKFKNKTTNDHILSISVCDFSGTAI